MTLFFLKTSTGKNSYKSGNIVTILCLPVINFPIQLMGSNIVDILISGPNIATLDKLTFPQYYRVKIKVCYTYTDTQYKEEYYNVCRCYVTMYAIFLPTKTIELYHYHHHASYIHIDEHTVKGVFACLEHANNSFEFCRVIPRLKRQFRVRIDPPPKHYHHHVPHTTREQWSRVTKKRTRPFFGQ